MTERFLKAQAQAGGKRPRDLTRISLHFSWNSVELFSLTPAGESGKGAGNELNSIEFSSFLSRALRSPAEGLFFCQQQGGGVVTPQPAGSAALAPATHEGTNCTGCDPPAAISIPLFQGKISRDSSIYQAPRRGNQELKRVNVDFLVWVIEALDKGARSGLAERLEKAA